MLLAPSHTNESPLAGTAMGRTIRLTGLFLFLITASTLAQFPQTLVLEATAPTIVSSAQTRAGWQYTITVTGTYSMWPPYDSYGVDGAYVYDVPEEEINAFRWPPEFMYPIPHWVGDTLEVPPFTFPGQQFKFRTRDNIGFRYNGQPLANSGLTTTHRYRTTLVGDGNPIAFQILDSAYSIREGRIIPRYEDNSGALTIVVEERPYFNVCNVETFCDRGQTVLAIAGSLLEYDSTGRPRNTLKSASQLAVVVDGRIIGADSVSCASREPVAYTLVLDRSGSMDFDYDGTTDRMTALKRAAHGFLKTMKPGDQAMLVTFSFDDDISLDVGWTGDTTILGRGIDAIDADGGTAWRDAAYVGLTEAAKHYNPRKAVVLLTDGEDTHSRRLLGEVVGRARQVNVPVFTIGMALADTSEAPLRYLAAQSNGRFFQARDQRAIDSAFNNLSRALESDDCCTLYVRLPREVTAEAGVRRFEIVARENGASTGAMQSYDIHVSDSCSMFSSAPAEAAAIARLSIAPNPIGSTATLELAIESPARVAIEIVAVSGERATLVEPMALGAGSRRFEVDLRDRPSGLYIVRALVDGAEVARERVVIMH